MRTTCLFACFAAACAALAAPAPQPKDHPFFRPGRDKPTDPDGDCKVTVGRDSVTMELPGRAHTFYHGHPGSKNAPRLMRPVDGDFVLTARVRGDFSISPISSTNRHASHAAAGLCVEVGDKYQTHVRVEYGATLEHNFPMSYPGLRTHQLSGVNLHNGSSSAHLAFWPYPPWHEARLRLERRGNALTVQVTADEDSTEYSYEYDKGDLPRTLSVGVIATTTSQQALKVTFDQIELSAPKPPKPRPVPR